MKESLFYVRCSTDGGKTFENVSYVCTNPLSAILIMRKKVQEKVSQLISAGLDVRAYQTSDSRWPDAWGYTNNGYTIEYGHEKKKIIYEVVDVEDLLSIEE